MGDARTEAKKLAAEWIEDWWSKDSMEVAWMRDFLVKRLTPILEEREQLLCKLQDARELAQGRVWYCGQCGKPYAEIGPPKYEECRDCHVAGHVVVLEARLREAEAKAGIHRDNEPLVITNVSTYRCNVPWHDSGREKTLLGLLETVTKQAEEAEGLIKALRAALAEEPKP